MKIHLTQHLPGGNCSLCRPGLSAPKKKICLFGVLRRFQHCTGHITTGSLKGRGNLVIVKFTPQFLWLLHDDMPKECGGIPSGSKVLLNMFPALKSAFAGQILILEFSKDGPADNSNEFTYRGLTNQPVIL